MLFQRAMTLPLLSSVFVDHGYDLSVILAHEDGIVGLTVKSAVAPSVFSEGGRLLFQDFFEVSDRASGSFEVGDRIFRLREHLARTTMANQSHRQWMLQFLARCAIHGS
jgi:hypothetical protein